MEQEQTQLILEPNQSKPIKEEKKVQAENMRLKKQIYELEKEIESLKRFIGGI